MTSKVLALNFPGGIQRDGTAFDSNVCVDGKWVRFQRNRPRKIGGYKGVFLNATGISRGMQMTSSDGLNYVVSGNANGLEQWVTDNDDGVGAGPYRYSLSNFTASTNNLWQFDIGYNTSGSGSNTLVAHPGQNLSAIDSITNTPVLYGAFPGSSGSLSMSKVGVFTAVAQLNGFSAIINGANSLIYPGQTMSGTGITSGTTVASVNVVASASFTGYISGTTLTVTAVTVGAIAIGQSIIGGSGVTVTVGTSITAYGSGIGGVGTYTVNLSQTVGTSGSPVSMGGGATTAVVSSLTMTTGSNITVTFDNNIAVSGGCVMIHPYLFVYGNNGLIQNTGSANFQDWTSPIANASNVATSKIVKGLPLRGGSSSPSGLFWSLDALVRVSYAPSVVSGITFYWNYDLISSQTSIMSSSCVIEYDGLYYWCGVDRFMFYNGAVQEIPNTLNQNYFFDNINFVQRQKVWVTKVPRWGEIWWFYPRGSSTECNDAIIYNVREKTWYDAGQALGARRSSGVFSEVFPKPLWADNTPLTTVSFTASISSTTMTVTAVQYGTLAVGQLINGKNIPANTYITAVGTLSSGQLGTYTISTALSVSSEVMTVTTYTIWQHESGTDQVYLTTVDAIQSYFETSSIGPLGGLVGSNTQPGANVWTRLERMEPDFIQSGTMTLTINGKGYADDTDQPSDPYSFVPSTLKVDMREQRREMRLHFESNTFGGNYELGKVLLSVTTGDSRSTGNP